jgi:hypothetical protein
MKAEEKIRELICKSEMQIGPDADKKILGDAAENLSRLKQQRAAKTGPSIWRIIMENKTMSFAAAAMIIIACMTGISLWRTTGSGIALADVLARIKQVNAFRCKGSFAMTGQAAPDKPYHWEVYFDELQSKEYGSKVIHEEPDPNGGKRMFAETYFSPSKKVFIQISRRDKKYTRTELDDAGVQQIRKEFNRFSDPRALLEEILSCKYKSLGRSTVDGIDVEGFGTTDPNCRGSGFGYKDPQVEVKIWVNVKTHLPVRYESLKSGLDETGNRMSHHFVMHDFQWDIQVDASEFEPPAAPNDYIVLVEKPLGPVNEETAIQALRQCVELLGEYPESLSIALPRGLQVELDRSSSPAATRLREELKELKEQDKMNRIIDAGKPIRLLFEFYIMGLVEGNKDPAYYGKTVTPKDADKVLLRWKLSDKEYRVIYGDLHAETVTPEKLSELEKALQK